MRSSSLLFGSSTAVLLLFISSAASAATNDDSDARARRFLATRTTTSLVTTAVDRFGDGDTIVRYAQMHRGLPVIGRGASVRLSMTGAPIATVLDLASDLPDTVIASVPPSDAARMATARTTIGASAEDAYLVVWPTIDRGTRLAWAVLPVIPAGYPMLPRVIIDAQTGDVLEVRDMIRFAKANVFASNPKKTPEATVVDLPITPDGTNLANAFFTSTNCIDNKTVKPLSFSGLDLNVHVCDLVQTAIPNASGDYIYEPSDVAGSTAARSDTFSEVSMYYHASKAYAFYRSLQGDAEAQVVVDKPLRLIANLQLPQGVASGDLSKAADPNLPLDPFQNAFFAPAAGGLGALFQQLYGFTAGALWFGQGPVRDYSYDGDVIYHELTHAVVDATLKLGAWHADARGAIDSPAAMNEGLADFFSSAITGDPNVGEYAAADLGLPDGEPIRTLDNKDTCAGLTGEAHADSTVFSGALWAARASLADADRTKFDATLYKAMRANPESSDLGYEDLAKLFLATLTTDLPAGAAALEAKMTERGLLPTCERITKYDGTPRKAPDARIGFVAPGKQSVNVKGTAPGIFHLTADVPASTASLTVSFSVRAPSQAGFGSTAKPFSPLVLAKIGSPITWDPQSKTGHDATFHVSVTPASGKASAVVTLPEGTPAGPIYVQIANTGDSDGSYDEVALDFTPVPAPPSSEPPAAAPPTAAPAADADSGCSASPASPNTTGPGMLAAIAALAVFRRRRRS